MTLQALIMTHGLWLVFVGTFLEGETVLVLGGIAAHGGYLRLPDVILVAFAGSLLCDQIFFQLGRRKGSAVLARWPAWEASIQHVDELLSRYDLLLIVGFRFLYGLRTVTPFAMGMSSTVSTARFAILNAMGAAIWACALGLGGYALGNVAQSLMQDAREAEKVLLGAVLAVGATLWLVRLVRRRHRRSGSKDRSHV